MEVKTEKESSALSLISLKSSVELTQTELDKKLDNLEEKEKSLRLSNFPNEKKDLPSKLLGVSIEIVG